jgi:thiamine-phosphate pyrophosphorylase
VLLCYITDGRWFPGDEATRRSALLAKIGAAARAGVNYIQLREKDLPTRALESLAHDAVRVVRENASVTRQVKVLINSRTDVALAVGADGVHLPSDDLSASDARAIWDLSSRNAKREMRNAVIGVSCHTLADVLAAESHGADFAVFGPVFEKEGRTGVGLEQLRAACRRTTASDRKTEAGSGGGMPVLALGGVTLANAHACLAAGAAGIAAIRLFQENDIEEVVAKLR